MTMRYMGEKMPRSPPASRFTAALRSIVCTAWVPLGAKRMNSRTPVRMCVMYAARRADFIAACQGLPPVVARSNVYCTSNPASFAAAMQSSMVRTSGSAFPSAIPSTTSTWRLLFLSYLLVRSHSYDEKSAPGLSTVNTFLYSAAVLEAWHAASMAYAPSKDSAGNTLSRSMKSPCLMSVRSETPASLLSFKQRPTWYSLMVMPVTWPPVAFTMLRMGPPTPQPMSSARMPGFKPIVSAMAVSWRMMDASKDSPISRAAKWKDSPQPYS
mmetsp:Transcript_8613/g.36451  ORF Transcript_8613/g.36451 Transcript_8613/m.36451 type:complete len:269 (-) Transcript_8613:468-1274(-)